METCSSVGLECDASNLGSFGFDGVQPAIKKFLDEAISACTNLYAEAAD